MPEMKSLTLNDKTYDCFVDSVARSLVEASVAIDSKSGENIVVTDASNYKVVGLRVFGKTTQDGTPTPDAPVELVSVGKDGSITVNVTGENDAKSVTVATPNGLPGIPVTSGGNYTDANGQQWICDEIDFARGVYVRRIGSVVYDGSTDELWNYESEMANTILIRMEDLNSVNVGIVVATDFLCSHFEVSGIYNIDSEGVQHSGQQFYLRILKSRLTTKDVSGFRTFLAVSPISISYALATPIETPLSEAELAAYAALHTYKDSTTVSNDSSAYMELEYAMDAKKYIDSMITAGIIEATTE